MKKICFFFFLSFFAFSCSKQGKGSSTAENRAIGIKSRKEAHEKIEGYHQRVLNGESMSVMATLYSEDPGSAKAGGRYDSVARGQFVPEFEAVAFRLKPGAISEIFETKYGFHFIQLIARRGEEVDLRHLLVVPK